MKHFYTILLFSLLAFTAKAQWNTDSLVRNAICTANAMQYNSQICTDGKKGAIMTWNDLRSSSAVYIQRIDSNGVTKWGLNGVQVNAGAGGIGGSDPHIIEDGSGGAFVVYNKTIIGGQEQVYAQHFNNLGQPQWAAGGIVINNTGDARMGNTANNQSLATDGNGGVFITWYQYTTGSDIMVQHLDANGNKFFPAQGLKISTTATFHYVARIANTGNNTFAIAYYDNSKLLLQRLDAAGSKLLGANGVEVVNTLDYSDNNTFYILYNANFIFLAWTDTRAVATAHGLDLYAQKLDINGVAKWQAGGVVIDSSTYNSLYPEIIPNKAGGFYISYGYAKGFVQNISKTGDRQWGLTGKPLATSSNQYYQHICDDGGTGLIVTWDEQRYSSKMDIFAQHFNSTGTATWRPNGLPVIITPNNVGISTQSQLLSLKNGRAIACWTDYRPGANGADIYAARFDSALPVKGPLALLTDKTDVTCWGGTNGTATALPYGGTTPYTFSWSNGGSTATITGLAAGTYTVTVTDNLGAQVMADIIIKQPAAPAISIDGADTTCGTPVTLTCTTLGATGYQWQKSNVDIAGATSSSYIANVSGSYKCIATYACATKQTPTALVSITNINATIDPSGTIDVCTNTPNIYLNATPASAAVYSFQWYKDDIAIPGATANKYKVVDVNATFYVVITKTANGCFDTSNATSVFKVCLTGELPGGTEASAASKSATVGIKAFPNPARSIVNVDLSALAATGDVLLKLTDASGRQVLQQKIAGGNTRQQTIDVSRQPAGIYTLTVQTGKQQFIQKIVVIK